ncbi:antibiotic biosynthesis monooxygenase [Pantoea sp. MQR6]|uniref:antibiotic biosynthesis monooxygenase n=1 Tax=Pantoea sp. MQR6 TaxID=2907307 RepID=UPI001FAB31A8|nr:antibiotic biosynthesis monooxygenase [Pantoea sp. MQR6]
MINPQQANHVTLVITHSLQPGKQSDYEAWLELIMPQAAQFPGHLGVNVLRPVHGENTYTVLIRFDNLDNLFKWTQSAERKTLIATLPAMLAAPEHTEVRPGAAFWFTPVDKAKPGPARWKQFLLTLAVIFPSTLLIPQLVDALLPMSRGTLWGHFLDDACVVALVVWLWMPLLTRLLRNWLLPRR